MIFSFHSLGCKVNQVELEKISSDLVAKGYQYTPDKIKADFLIINTCTVTEKSDQKSLRTINKYSKYENLKRIFVTGCYTELEKELKTKIHSKNVIVSQKLKMSIPTMVDKILAKDYGFADDEISGKLNDYHDKWQAFKNSRNYIGALSNHQATFFDHKRAFIKVQDGCNYFCSYCRIPFSRGGPVSRDAEDILTQVRLIEQSKIPEIVLSGINIGIYHDQASGLSFGGLLNKILDELDYTRLRISSIEPYSLDDEFFSLLNHPKLVPHIHLALQGTSDRILKEMNRRYNLAEFKAILNHFYQANPNFSVSTDIIVGFDDETDEEFEQGLNFVRNCQFSSIHVFPFSKRPLTKMMEVDELARPQVDQSIKKIRSAKMREVSKELSNKFVKKLEDKAQYFIIEDEIDINQKLELYQLLAEKLLKQFENLKVFKGTTEYYLKGYLLVEEKEVTSDRMMVKIMNANSFNQEGNDQDRGTEVFFSLVKTMEKVEV